MCGESIRFSTPGWTTKSAVVSELRDLRTLAEVTKAHDFERDLFIEERKAERGILLSIYLQGGWKLRVWPRLFAHCLWIAAMGLYWLLADYGRSFLRPLIALVASIFFFHAAYGALLKPAGGDDDAFKRALTAFSVAHAVPFVGSLTLDADVKATLLCGGRPADRAETEKRAEPACRQLPSLGFQLLVLGQSIVSAMLVFFIVLALRRFFKLS